MQIRCPGCKATLKLAQPPTSGQKFQCPKCEHRFRLQSRTESPKKPPAKRPKPRPAEVDEFDDFDDPWSQPEPPRSRRSSGGSRGRGSSSKKKSSDKPAWVLPVAVAGGGVTVVALVIIAVIMLFGRKEKPAANNVANNEKSQPVVSPPERKFSNPNKSVAQNPRPKPKKIEPVINLPKVKVPTPIGGGGNNGQMKAEVLNRVKRATVLLRVTDSQGERASGTGFFAVDKSVIITNAHVVGMLEPGTRKPRKLEIVLNSGQADEHVLNGHVTAVDRSSDLAVVQYRSSNGLKMFPEPLKVFSAKNLIETQNVFVFGFPFGEKLGKEIVVRPSAVASLRKDKHGELKQVQVHGGMNPGNSGGPVVDGAGNVVGVAVAGIPGTQINFAIPGDRLYRMLDGRISGVSLGDSKQVNKKFQLPVTVTAIDPLRRLKTVKLTWWVGKQGKPRDPTSKIPKQLPGDSLHQTVDLTYKNGIARGTLTIPAVPEGETVFLQPLYQTSEGALQWMASINYDPGPLLDQLTVLVSRKPRKSNGDLYLNSRSTMSFDFFGGEEQSLLSHIDSKLREQTYQVTSSEVRKQMTIGKMEWGISINKKAAPRSVRAQQAMQYLNGVSYLRNENMLGIPTFTQIRYAGVPKTAQPILTGMSKQVLDSLDLVSIPIKAQMMKPGTRWTSTRRAPFTMPGTYRSVLIVMTYTYKGVATYYGHRVAVIKVSGRIPTRKSGTFTVAGGAQGNAYLDLSRRRIIVADLTLDYSLVAKIGADKAKADGQTRVKLSRIPPNTRK